MEDHPTLPGVSGSTPERKFHPVANVFPLLQGAEFQALVDDIQRHGLREPILCDGDGRILDGRNRYRACLEGGIEARFVQWHGGGPLPELALSLNLRRRHLDESQRAMVAARLAKMLVPIRDSPDADKSAYANLRTGERTRDVAAAMVNVSRRLVDHACRVINNGGNELIAAVESGGLAVSAASLLAGLTKPEQAEAVAGGAQAAAVRARELRARKAQSAAPATSPGSFGVLGATTPEVPTNDVVFLWVEAGSLTAAIAALRSRGFELSQSPA